MDNGVVENGDAGKNGWMDYGLPPTNQKEERKQVNICTSHRTSDIAYEGRTCPACELEKQLEQAEDELKDVYEQNRELVGQIAELEKELALERDVAK